MASSCILLQALEVECARLREECRECHRLRQLELTRATQLELELEDARRHLKRESKGEQQPRRDREAVVRESEAQRKSQHASQYALAPSEQQRHRQQLDAAVVSRSRPHGDRRTDEENDPAPIKKLWGIEVGDPRRDGG